MNYALFMLLMEELYNMKITKDYLRNLIMESIQEAEAFKGPDRGKLHKAKSREELSKIAMSSGQGIASVKKYAQELAASSDERNKKVGEKILSLLKSE